MTSQYIPVITQTGQALITDSIVNGSTITLKYFAWGDGGGSSYTPNASQTVLFNEVYRQEVNSVEIDLNNPNWLDIVTEIPQDIGGFTVREVGIFTIDNQLFCVASHPEFLKPTADDGTAFSFTETLILEITNLSQVTIELKPQNVVVFEDITDHHHTGESPQPSKILLTNALEVQGILPGDNVEDVFVHNSGDTITGTLVMGSDSSHRNKITNLAEGTEPSDAVVFSQLMNNTTISGTPYSAISGRVNSSGCADFIVKDSNTQVSILSGSNSPNIVACYADGKGEPIEGDQIINLPNDTVSPEKNDGLYIFVKEKINTDIKTIQIGEQDKNLLLDFSNSLTEDRYGNFVNVIGNPTVYSGKYTSNGTSDGLEIGSIYTLGTGKWTLEGRFKFNSVGRVDSLFRGELPYSLRLSKELNNKLQLWLSSNGASWNIANAAIGNVVTLNNVDEYHIALEFDGSSYKVYVNGVLNITVASTTKVTQNIRRLLFGINSDESTLSLSGTMDDLRVTLGYNRYGQVFTPPPAGTLVKDKNTITETFMPPTSGDGVDGDYWLDCSVKPYRSYKKVNGSWTSFFFVKLGEVSKVNGVLGTPISYAFNARYLYRGTLTTGQVFTHNIGSSLCRGTPYWECLGIIPSSESNISYFNIGETTGLMAYRSSGGGIVGDAIYKISKTEACIYNILALGIMAVSFSTLNKYGTNYVILERLF